MSIDKARTKGSTLFCWRYYHNSLVKISTDRQTMYLPLVGLFAVALSNQVFKKPQEFCPYGQTTYIKVSTSSVISCAAKCDTDKGGCSRFVYDADQGECTMYWSIVGIMNGSIDTSTGRTLFLSSRKGIY